MLRNTPIIQAILQFQCAKLCYIMAYYVDDVSRYMRVAEFGTLQMCTPPASTGCTRLLHSRTTRYNNIRPVLMLHSNNTTFFSLFMQFYIWALPLQISQILRTAHFFQSFFDSYTLVMDFSSSIILHLTTEGGGQMPS